MKTFRQSVLAFLMAFSPLGLVACDGGEVDDGLGNGGATELEEPATTEEPLD